jgi:predicted GH43/DUF377 family glycosyl hydrolase
MPRVKKSKKISAPSTKKRVLKKARGGKRVTRKVASKREPTAAIRISKTARRAMLLQAIRDARAQRQRREPRAEQPLQRHEDNPIIEPREHNFWEMKATFNPGAIYADKRVHLLYRAIGGDDISVLGYAASDDGMNISERSAEPAFVPQVLIKRIEASERLALPAVAYSSGGGWNGGCEDPRITLIDNVVYLVYTAFDGWGSIRIALSSIPLDDFLKKKWNWKKAALISPPGEIHKNWMLFPEKVNGKYAILHSISPDVLVDYFDTMEELERGERVIHSKRAIQLRKGVWDSWIRGAGPPPIKTKLGWLLFYHAMDARDPDRYKLGAMILDANDPTKILYRSQGPILEPDAYYENSGFKAGVVYSCGAVVKDGTLYVYYGGSDSVTCVAMADLDHFLDDLRRDVAPKLQPEAKARK